MTRNNTFEPVQPLLPANWWGLALRAVLGTLLIVVANLVRLPFHHWAEAAFPSPNANLAATTVIFLLTPAVVIPAVAAWMRWVEKAPIGVTGLLRVRKIIPGMAGGIALAAVAVAAGWAILVLVDAASTSNPPLDDLAASNLALILLFMTTRAFLLQGLPEELIFRGWLFHLTRHRPLLTVAWTTVAFTVIHLTSSGGQQNFGDRLFYLMVPFGMGLLAGSVVLWKGLWWAVGTHGGFHVSLEIASAIYPLELGRIAWVTLGVSQALVGAGIVWWWLRARTAAEAGAKASQQVIS
ncbi:CAAX amino terminal protease self- immunity [Corynebacterium atrinae]|uniref:CPBP family intramembrane glutamic endopeptidase n=1 Tax=Corynebacterium atrinae TaxID=1336740 RepID=UPI0025B324FE|nr:CPBP family intramembrane glutamic endopeptidase [Corynebacterium atrinae]WJY62816.1 CAAX amino terminal protease self- immunity [Corynebacterium atrinae]